MTARAGAPAPTDAWTRTRSGSGTSGCSGSRACCPAGPGPPSPSAPRGSMNPAAATTASRSLPGTRRCPGSPEPRRPRGSRTSRSSPRRRSRRARPRAGWQSAKLSCSTLEIRPADLARGALCVHGAGDNTISRAQAERHFAWDDRGDLELDAAGRDRRRIDGPAGQRQLGIAGRASLDELVDQRRRYLGGSVVGEVAFDAGRDAAVVGDVQRRQRCGSRPVELAPPRSPTPPGPA